MDFHSTEGLYCLVHFIVNDFAPSGILAWLRASGLWLYRSAQAIDILLIFSSPDGTSSVRLKLCCTAVPRMLIFSSLDMGAGTTLKLGGGGGGANVPQGPR